MKKFFNVCLLSACLPVIIVAGEKPADDVTVKHREGAAKVADQQDNLAADVQQLTAEQTIPQVIALLNEVEEIMDESTDKLAESDTGGATLAAQTEVIEKIHAAAKEKQKQQGAGKSGSALMDMMERMMGKKPDGDGEGKGEKPSDQGSQGQTGASDTANEGVAGRGDGKTETRRVPKASGGAGRALPEEFRNALDAYNRGVQQNLK